ncbi:MAG: hypothetical protein SGI90_02670 [Candidatus Eisenbacteria bacterium]|nr:hypothetical protein [Candidatus Eisenbacteria bacterium]
MRKAIAAAMLLSLAILPQVAKADVFLADFTGFDWTWPNNSCLDCTNQYYEAQGTIGAVNPTFLNYNYAANQYTFILGDNLFFSSADTFGTIVVAHYVNGSIHFICDSKTTGTAATFNYLSDCDPFFDRLTFADGDTTLSGNFSSFDIVFDTVNGDGNLAGLTNWYGGSQIGNIPVNQRTGWTFGAIGIRTGITPCGYHWQVDGECYLQETVNVRPATWGQIKNLLNPNARVQIRR